MAPVDLAAQVHRRELILRGEGQMAESQLSELRNMRVLLEEARLLTRNLAYHRRATLEVVLGQVLDEIDRQIEELRTRSCARRVRHGRASSASGGSSLRR